MNLCKKVQIKKLDYLKTFFTITIITVIFAAISLFASTCIYFCNAREIPETNKKLKEQQLIIDQQKNYLDVLKDRVQALENDKVNEEGTP